MKLMRRLTNALHRRKPVTWCNTPKELEYFAARFIVANNLNGTIIIIDEKTYCLELFVNQLHLEKLS